MCPRRRIRFCSRLDPALTSDGTLRRHAARGSCGIIHKTKGSRHAKKSNRPCSTPLTQDAGPQSETLTSAPMAKSTFTGTESPIGIPTVNSPSTGGDLRPLAYPHDEVSPQSAWIGLQSASKLRSWNNWQNKKSLEKYTHYLLFLLF